jgi:hypothetical protein
MRNAVAVRYCLNRHPRTVAPLHGDTEVTEHVTMVRYGHRDWVQVTVRDHLGRCGVSVRDNETDARNTATARLRDWQFWRPAN